MFALTATLIQSSLIFTLGTRRMTLTTHSISDTIDAPLLLRLLPLPLSRTPPSVAATRLKRKKIPLSKITISH